MKARFFKPVYQKPLPVTAEGAFVLSADLPAHMAAGFIFGHQQLIFNFLFEFRDMGNNGDHFFSAGHALQHAYGLTARAVVQ